MRPATSGAIRCHACGHNCKQVISRHTLLWGGHCMAGVAGAPAMKPCSKSPRSCSQNLLAGHFHGISGLVPLFVFRRFPLEGFRKNQRNCGFPPNLSSMARNVALFCCASSFKKDLEQITKIMHVPKSCSFWPELCCCSTRPPGARRALWGKHLC